MYGLWRDEVEMIGTGQNIKYIIYQIYIFLTYFYKWQRTFKVS